MDASFIYFCKDRVNESPGIVVDSSDPDRIKIFQADWMVPGATSVIPGICESSLSSVVGRYSYVAN